MNSSVQSIRRIASNLLWTHGGFLRHPIVDLATDGRIIRVGQCEAPDSLAGVEFYAGILTPGLINTHCHIELSHLSGAISEGCGFAGFAQAMGRVRAGWSLEQQHAAVEAADAQMWSEGIQAVGDIANGEVSFSIKERSPIVYRTFAELFGLQRQSSEHLHPLLRHPKTSITPHSLYSLQDKPFREICTQGDTPLSIHFMESPAEAKLYRRRGELWEWYTRAGLECDFLDFGSPAARLVESVPRDRSVILVHNCCVTQRDIDVVMEHFTAPVWWCLCPQSNHYISRLEPPVELLQRNALNICLGTDSLASSHSLSLFEQMRALKGVSFQKLLTWAVNGARALELSDKLGEIAPGNRCGLNVISGVDYQTMTLQEASRIRRII